MEVAFELNHAVTALFGPSGAGKTSTLWMIAGLLRPAEGKVRVQDDTLLDTAAGICLPPERRRIGMVFQDQLLFPHLTVEAKSLFKNNLAVCTICVFRFQGWRDGHGRQGAQANPSVSLSWMSGAQRCRIAGVPPGHQSCDGGAG
jgi:ABC-type proline/glycine betaine transport system ATPase subunit